MPNISEEDSKTNIYAQKLHLHTLESLCNDLVGGHAVEYGSNSQRLTLDKNSRSVLSWYWKNQGLWAKNLSGPTVQAILSSLDTDPPELEPSISASSTGEKKLLRLAKLEAHRFAGVHAYGTETDAPENFIFEPTKAITVFEGANGSGKTSLLNAIIWCLTGEIIRPQRPPERGDSEFEIEIEREENSSLHNIPPVTPMPRTGVYVPGADIEKIPVDTWVELTFEDRHGNVLPKIRRSLTRTNRGKIQESEPDLSVLGIDPISFRTGTTMPAILPFIQIGEQSELGRAVAELTGLSSLIALSRHATKVSNKISGEMTKAVKTEENRIDQEYERSIAELDSKITEHPALLPKDTLPRISDDKQLETKLGTLKSHFQSCKAKSFTDAVSVLGEDFDADDQVQIKELEGKISPAISKVGEIKYLPSANRLAQLAVLNEEQIKSASDLLQKICDEAATLAELASNPDTAKRNKLYARIAEWMKEFNIDLDGLHFCPVCSTDFGSAIDPITDNSVKDHIGEHLEQNSTLISQSIQAWIKSTVGVLATELPSALSQESGKELPDHPVSLIKSALVDELFAAPAFGGVLSLLKKNMGKVFEGAFSGFDRLDVQGSYKLPDSMSSLAKDLQISLNRVERAIEFAQWRKSNKDNCIDINKKVIGIQASDDDGDKIGISADSSLLDRLNVLKQVTESAAPINECLEKVQSLKNQVELRREEEKKLKRYVETIDALTPILDLGNLAAQQIADLQSRLKQSTEKWREAVYLNYYSKSGHSLADTKLAPEGQLSISVGSNGAVAPAQHVSNASALRASLLGFYIAFWEHVLKTRGGLKLMLLDDPQELLDEENEKRLGESLPDIVAIDAQLFVTTHDQRFASLTVRVPNAADLIEHRSVHPVNNDRGTLKVPLAITDIDRKRKAFYIDEDHADNARDYLSECRVFIEARLSDLFDDPAYSTRIHKPTLADYVLNARRLLKANPIHELFASTPFKKFCNDPALQDGHKCLARLNAAHHEGKRDIMPSDVSDIKDDLERVMKLAESLHDIFRAYRRREPSSENTLPINITKLQAANSPDFGVPIFPDLAAFTGQSPTIGTQDVEQDLFSSDWFEDKALFYLRNDMFGFSAPAGSIAVVEIDGAPARDQNLVIARHMKKYLARRLLRNSADSHSVTLATVSTDPRLRPPSIVVPTNEVELFRVVGFLFGGSPPEEMSKKHDAIPIQETDIFHKIKTCHRVRDTSAEPLALKGQLVLGGKEYLPEELIRNHDQLVAIALDDGSGIFKKIGSTLPGDLGHLCLFESIGGKGASEIASLDKDHGLGGGIRAVETAREILGVIYEA